MTFSVGQAQPTALDTILGGLTSGAAKGLQQSLKQFHARKQKSVLEDKFEAAGLPREYASLPIPIVKELMASEQKRSLMEQYFRSQEGEGVPPPGDTTGIGSDLQPPQEGEGILHPGETPGTGSDLQPSEEISAKDVEAAYLLDPGLGRAKQQDRKLQQQELQQVQKRNLQVYDKASKDLISLKEADLGLAQLESLSKKIGKTQGQSFFDRLARSYRFDPETKGFTRFGKVTSTPEEERYIKLIADQTKNIKDDFGARITNLDLEVFLRRFPDLMMTPEGREQIMGTLRDYNEAKRIYNEALRDEIKISKGKADPYELDEIVERKIAPQLDKIRERIRTRGFSKGSEQSGEVEMSEKIEVFDASGKLVGKVDESEVGSLPEGYSTR